ncbi:hypothetical protein ABT095_19545 [Kitasatospora sp. NPDC002227]|uniref:hypothetical protein n=1 Tax=Kitasatospora sp. NPDC002227 TaxID=3154773 RepID=UPI003332647B
MAGLALVVGVAGARAEHQMAARLGVGREPVEQRVLGEVEPGDDQHGVALRRRLGCQVGAFACRVVQLTGVQDPHLAAGLASAIRSRSSASRSYGWYSW